MYLEDFDVHTSSPSHGLPISTFVQIQMFNVPQNTLACMKRMMNNDERFKT
jgi:hypothetical protein